MIIPIDEEWRIATDEYQWIVQRSQVAGDNSRNPGSIRWINQSFHGSLDSAIRSLGQRMLRTSNAETLAEALEVFKNVSDTLSQALTIKQGVAA